MGVPLQYSREIELTELAKPLRADAARNRARVLEVAYETFAAEGLAAPIDEIARRAGVGTGTVCRHFPSKADLYRAVLEDRINHIVADGRVLLASTDPAEALFAFMRSMVLQWGARDQGLVDALAGSGIDIDTALPASKEAYLTLLGDLLTAAQKAGTARPDVDARGIKALLIGCHAIQSHSPELIDGLTEVVIDGLRHPASGPRVGGDFLWI